MSHSFDALVDTGFNGYLTLPSSSITALGLTWICRQQGLLADGSTQVFEVYKASFDWDGQTRFVETEEVDAQPLIGMALLQGSELHMDVNIGGDVRIGK